MQLVLAPMEGLLDAPMRALLTSLGHYDWCVSEFVRVTDRVHPLRVFRRHCPELDASWRTPAGTPVHLQLLGSEPAVLAENAAFIAQYGPPGIDLNFGCPARTVNRHRGGAVLLDEPELVHAIVAAVRRAVPPHIPVSAKMRLGYRDRARLLDNARGIAAAGASWLVVHARTKEDGYRPPAHWHEVARVREAVPGLPVIVNGEVWTVADSISARRESGCADLMTGRGAVARPDLAAAIRADAAGRAHVPADWAGLLQVQRDFVAGLEGAERVVAGRYKQWLALLIRGWPAEAAALFAQVRRLERRADIDAVLAAAQCSAMKATTCSQSTRMPIASPGA